MKKLILAALVLVGLTCQAQKNNTEKETVVVIKTNMGTIKAKLYNDTPLHRDNFIKLVNEGWYNGSPFHRVIKDFMIQGGQMPTVVSTLVTQFLQSLRTIITTRKAPSLPPAKATK